MGGPDCYWCQSLVLCDWVVIILKLCHRLLMDAGYKRWDPPKQDLHEVSKKASARDKAEQWID